MNIIFDMDDTIYDLSGPFKKAHQDLFADRTDADPETIFQLSRIYSEKAFYRQERGEITKKEEFAYRIRNCYKDVGVVATDDEAEEFENRYRYYQKHIDLFDGMEEILDFLKNEGITIGLLTNGEHPSQYAKIDCLDLYRWFSKDRIFISGDMKVSKPSKEAYQYVEEHMNLCPEDTVFVGDAFEMDIEGAKGAGWKAVFFNHRRRKLPENRTCEADAICYTMEELYDIIKSIVTIGFEK